MAEEESKPLTYIPEVVLKKRRSNEKWAIRRKQQLEEKLKRVNGDKFAIKKPEQFIHEYRDKELDLVQMKYRGKKRKHSSVVPESRLLFIVRIGGENDMHPKTRKTLYSLGLRRIFTGVFVKANGRIMDILQRIEPYVTYGYPNLKSIKDLVYKKGLAKIDRQRVPLTDNTIIEQALGQHGILCIEDLVNEIASVGQLFKEATRFLYPFTLNKPEKSLRGEKKLYKDGGDAGNREDNINELISRMN